VVYGLHLVILAAVGLLSLQGIEELRTTPGLVAMYFSYAALWGLFAISTMNVTMGVLTNLTSLEPLLDYITGGIPEEPPWQLASDPEPGMWPTAGALKFQDLHLRYRPELPKALDGFELEVAGGEKLGVVGLTGAGRVPSQQCFSDLWIVRKVRFSSMAAVSTRSVFIG